MKVMADRIEMLKAILPHVSRYKLQWFFLVVLKIGQKLPLLLQPLLFKTFINGVIESQNLSYMLPLMVMCGGLFLVETVLKVGHRVVDNSFFNRITRELRNDVWNRYSSMPWEEYGRFQVSDMVRRLNQDIDMVKFFMIGEVFDYLSSIVSIIISFALMISLSWHLAIVAGIFVLISLFLTSDSSKLLYQKILESIGEREREIMTEMEDRVQRISFDWREVKANHLEGIEKSRLEDILQNLHANRKKREEILFRRNMILDLKGKVIDSLGMHIVCGVFNIFWNLKVGTVIACISYYGNILQDFKNIMEIDANLGWVKPSILRVIEVLDIPGFHFPSHYPDVPEEHNDVADNRKEDISVYELKIDGYRYGELEEEVLGQVVIKVKKGEKLLLDGISGSGKSTLMKLMAGELTTEKEQIFLKEVCMNQLSKREIYQHIRKLDAEQYIMNITVQEYLRMAKEDADYEEMRQACMAVGLWQELAEISPDLQLRIGENGTYLSGGQKQKLALARVFLRGDRILLLDEAFSAIDGKDKVQIMEHLLEKYQNGTIIGIAHDDEIKRKFRCSYVL